MDQIGCILVEFALMTPYPPTLLALFMGARRRQATGFFPSLILGEGPGMGAMNFCEMHPSNPGESARGSLYFYYTTMIKIHGRRK
jgi:hypothetical protein